MVRTEQLSHIPSRTALVLWCLNASKWQQGGVTVINPSPSHACHHHNKATKPDAKASPHIYCYNYLTFKSTLMSPGWSPSLSSFGFEASFYLTRSPFKTPWNTHPPHKYTSTCICSTPPPPSPSLPQSYDGEITRKQNKGGVSKAGFLCFLWSCISRGSKCHQCQTVKPLQKLQC